MKKMADFPGDERGAAIAEYTVLIGIIAGGFAVVVFSIGPWLEDMCRHFISILGW